MYRGTVTEPNVYVAAGDADEAQVDRLDWFFIF
jgi:hypothetical protein